MLSTLASYEFLFPLLSDSPYSEHGTLEEVDQDAGTEPHTSEDGMHLCPCYYKISLYIHFLRIAYNKNSVDTKEYLLNMCKVRRITLQWTLVEPPPSLRERYHYLCAFLNPLPSLPLQGNHYMFVLLSDLLFHFLFSWTFHKWNHMYILCMIFFYYYISEINPLLHAVIIIYLPIFHCIYFIIDEYVSCFLFFCHQKQCTYEYFKHVSYCKCRVSLGYTHIGIACLQLYYILPNYFWKWL